MNTQTQQKNVVTLKPSRLPMNAAIAKEYDITAPQWRVLTDQIFPTAKSQESILMALSYCKSRNLDIFKKPVHIVPMWSSEKGKMVETVWPGISEIRTTAARTGEYAGCSEIEYGPEEDRVFSGKVKSGNNWSDTEKSVIFPQWAKITVYRIIKGNRCPFPAKVFWLESYATIGKSELPNEMWSKRPYGQLAKCVEAAAIRMAFPEEVGNDYIAEEMHGQTIDLTANDRAEEAPKLVPPPPPEDETNETSTGGDEAIIDVPETPEELFERAVLWGNNVNTTEDLEIFLDEFNPHMDSLGDDDRAQLETILNAVEDRIQALNSSTLMAG